MRCLRWALALTPRSLTGGLPELMLVPTGRLQPRRLHAALARRPAAPPHAAALHACTGQWWPSPRPARLPFQPVAPRLGPVLGRTWAPKVHPAPALNVPPIPPRAHVDASRVSATPTLAAHPLSRPFSAQVGLLWGRGFRHECRLSRMRPPQVGASPLSTPLASICSRLEPRREPEKDALPSSTAALPARWIRDLLDLGLPSTCKDLHFPPPGQTEPYPFQSSIAFSRTPGTPWTLPLPATPPSTQYCTHVSTRSRPRFWNDLDRTNVSFPTSHKFFHEWKTSHSNLVVCLYFRCINPVSWKCADWWRHGWSP